MAIDGVPTEDWKTRKTSKSLSDGLTGVRTFNIYSTDTNELESVIHDACPFTFQPSPSGSAEIGDGPSRRRCANATPARTRPEQRPGAHRCAVSSAAAAASRTAT